MWPPSCAGLSEQATLSLAPVRVRWDYDSLTIGAKPFISFLVWPVFSNWTSIMSPATEITVPVPKVLWLTVSPAAKSCDALARSTLRSTVGDTLDDGFLARGAPEPKVEATRPASGETPRWRSVP